MKHHSSIVTLRCALMTLALAACSEATPEATLAEAGVDESTAISEQRVLVTGPNARNSTSPLQGAILSCLQDGLLTTYETDAQGVATLTINPKGGTVTVSVSLPGYLATTLVNYDKAVFHELAHDQGIWLPGPVAETSRLAPWRGKDHYDITLRGRADLMQRPDVHMRVQLVNSRQEYTALNFRDGLRSSLDDTYLAPPEVLTLPDTSSDHPLTWRIVGGEMSWVFLIAGDAEGKERWQAMVPPGVTTLDMSQLASVLSPEELGSSALDAVLVACEPGGKRNGCKRESVSAPFALPRMTTKPPPG